MAALRRTGRWARRACLAVVLALAIIILPPAWFLGTLLAADYGRIGNHRSGNGLGNDVKLVVIEGHGRFALCRMPVTISYLGRAFSGRVSASTLRNTESAPDISSFGWRSHRRPWDYAGEIYFGSGKVYCGPIHLTIWHKSLIIGLPPAGLVWTTSYSLVGPRYPPRSIRRLVRFLAAGRSELADKTGRTF